MSSKKEIYHDVSEENLSCLSASRCRCLLRRQHSLIYSFTWLALCRPTDSKPSSSYIHFSSPPPPNHFSSHIKFFPPLPTPPSPPSLPALCHQIVFDRKYSRRCGAVVDLTLWQTGLIGLICIHKSIGYLTLANILGSGERWCWVGQVTLSLVMELWWSVTALQQLLTDWRGGSTAKNDGSSLRAA